MIRVTRLGFLVALALFFCPLSTRTTAAGDSTNKTFQFSTDQIQGKLSEASRLTSELQYIRAEVLLRELIAEHPRLIDAQFMLASVLIGKSSYQEARELLDRLMEQNPDNALVMNNYAWLLATATDFRFRDPQRALSLARDALFLSPNDYHIWSTLAEAHYVNRDYEKAVKAMEKGLELAILRKASDDAVREYRLQLRKLQDVLVSMSLIE